MSKRVAERAQELLDSAEEMRQLAHVLEGENLDLREALAATYQRLRDVRATEDEAGSSAAGVDGATRDSGHHEPVGERQGRQPASSSVRELVAVATELARWSEVALKNGDLHGRLASALARFKDYEGDRPEAGKDAG